MEKKMGLITFHNVPNYGAALQAYALCNYINRQGVPCEIIDYKCKKIVKKELKFDTSRKGIDKLFYSIFIWRNIKKRIRGFETFWKLSGMISPISYDKQNIKEADFVYNYYLSGSDQVWNLSLTDNDTTYFLDFTEKYKFSFASSARNFWSGDEIPLVRELLSKYKMISVREKDTALQICEELGINCEWIEDPTFLLYKKWDCLAKKPKEKEYILVYYPDNQLLYVAQQYARKNNKRILVIQDGIRKRIYKKINPINPEEWLGYIKYAEAVFTNSYHGLLFSIYFQKNVWTFNDGNRQKSVINELGIDNCLLKEKYDSLQEIDYSQVSKKIEKVQETQKKYVKRMVELL